MAKAAILDVLEHTIGKYVKNLDAGEFEYIAGMVTVVQSLMKNWDWNEGSLSQSPI